MCVYRDLDGVLLQTPSRMGFYKSFAKIFLLALVVGTDIMWCSKVLVCLQEEENVTCKYTHNSRIMKESVLFSHSGLCVQRGRDALTHWKSSLIQTNTGFTLSPSIIYHVGAFLTPRLRDREAKTNFSGKI